MAEYIDFLMLRFSRRLYLVVEGILDEFADTPGVVRGVSRSGSERDKEGLKDYDRVVVFERILLVMLRVGSFWI